MARDNQNFRAELTHDSLLVNSNFGSSTLTATTLLMGSPLHGTVERGPSDGRIGLDADLANVYLGGSGADGDVLVRNESGDLTISLNGAAGHTTLGGHGTDGVVRLMDEGGHVRVRISAADAEDWPSEGASGDTVHLLRELKSLKERVIALEAQVAALS